MLTKLVHLAKQIGNKEALKLVESYLLNDFCCSE